MTDHPYGRLSPVEYQTHIRLDADRLLGTLGSGRLGKPVVSCPGWTLRDLVEHTGCTHQRARIAIVEPEPDGEPTPASPPGPSEDLAQWYDRSVTALLGTLHATDPATVCRTLQESNPTARFWSRRQAHELAMHRVDAEITVGRDAHYDPVLAVDGIAEVLDVFAYRRRHWTDVGPLRLHAPVLFCCTDRPERWLVRPTPVADGPAFDSEGPMVPTERAESAAVSVHGKAADLLLAIWRRTNLDAAEVIGDIRIDGDASVVRGLLTSRITP